MKRIALLLALIAALCLPAAAGAVLSPLHLGDTGLRVRDAQYLLSGHNRYGIHSYFGARDARYGPLMSKATLRAKYLLGYPSAALDGLFGHQLWSYLTGHAELSQPFRARRHSRTEAKRYLGAVYFLGNCRYSPPKPFMLLFVKRVSVVYQRPLGCISGTRHSYVAGTAHLSMHNWGDAADISTPTISMNLIVGRDALVAAGMTRVRADQYYTFAGWFNHVNILFHTLIGGNHFNHVHVGIWPYDWLTVSRTPVARAVAQLASVEHLSWLWTVSSLDETGRAHGEQGTATGAGAWSFYYRRGMSVDTARRQAGLLAMKEELVYVGEGQGIATTLPVFGDAMYQRVLEFQRAHSLEADGVIGPSTARVLFRERANAIEMAQQMPGHLLARLKSLESVNDPVAQGVIDAGDEGMLQIHLSFYPTLTREQAWAPSFILPWAGLRLRGFYSTLHDWDAVIAAWNIGLPYAKQWLAAGKPQSGGPLLGGVDSFNRATLYVRYVKDAAY